MQFRQLLNRFRSSRGSQIEKPQITKQPVPGVTPSDVERIIRRDFAAEKFAQVMALLDEYGEEKWQVDAARVRLAALKLANGDLGKLRVLVESAKQDYRDTVAAAEYPAYMRTGFRVRELPSKEQHRIIDSDWRQYEEWLRKSQ